MGPRMSTPVLVAISLMAPQISLTLSMSMLASLILAFCMVLLLHEIDAHAGSDRGPGVPDGKACHVLDLLLLLYAQGLHRLELHDRGVAGLDEGRLLRHDLACRGVELLLE